MNAPMRYRLSLPERLYPRLCETPALILYCSAPSAFRVPHSSAIFGFGFPITLPSDLEIWFWWCLVQACLPIFLNWESFGQSPRIGKRANRRHQRSRAVCGKMPYFIDNVVIDKKKEKISFGRCKLDGLWFEPQIPVRFCFDEIRDVVLIIAISF